MSDLPHPTCAKCRWFDEDPYHYGGPSYDGTCSLAVPDTYEHPFTDHGRPMAADASDDYGLVLRVKAAHYCSGWESPPRQPS